MSIDVSYFSSRSLYAIINSYDNNIVLREISITENIVKNYARKLIEDIYAGNIAIKDESGFKLYNKIALLDRTQLIEEVPVKEPKKETPAQQPKPTMQKTESHNDWLNYTSTSSKVETIAKSQLNSLNEEELQELQIALEELFVNDSTTSNLVFPFKRANQSKASNSLKRTRPHSPQEADHTNPLSSVGRPTDRRSEQLRRKEEKQVQEERLQNDRTKLRHEQQTEKQDMQKNDDVKREELKRSAQKTI